ncbi:MAG: YceI family protein [Pseudomonadota bacterium]|nr:YceI family protein [Pseudomonadota bacterium]
MRRLLALAALLSLAAAPGPSYHYWLDGTHSSVSARVSYMGFASKTARFPQMRGSIRLNPARLDAIDLDVELDAGALIGGSTGDTKYLRGTDFFAVEQYPVVRFSGHKMVMSGPTTAVVEGMITTRGITRPAALAVAFDAPPARATGRDPIVLSARTSINRRDFGMTAYSVVVGKTVAITIDARLMPG